MFGATATVIGALEDWDGSLSTIQLAVYSDELTDVMRDDQQFGEARLVAALKSVSERASDHVVSELLGQVQDFFGGGPSDHLTLIAKVR